MSIINPTNEQETIVRFVQRCTEMELEIVSMWSIYPDADIRNLKSGMVYRTEFEYKLSSFLKHKHNPMDCGLIICWINDIPKIKFPVTVFELNSCIYPEIVIPDSKETYDFYKRTVLDKKTNLSKYPYQELPSDFKFLDRILGK